MSEGMQAIAGNRLRQLIHAGTNNRIFACLVGVFVTCMIQSSSVTTVMTVGFVNSGLMTLNQAIGVILGANIGTTITGWILVLKVGKWGLPLLGLAAFFFLFTKNEKVRFVAMMLMGIGMVFFWSRNHVERVQAAADDAGVRGVVRLLPGHRVFRRLEMRLCRLRPDVDRPILFRHPWHYHGPGFGWRHQFRNRSRPSSWERISGPQSPLFYHRLALPPAPNALPILICCLTSSESWWSLPSFRFTSNLWKNSWG